MNDLEDIIEQKYSLQTVQQDYQAGKKMDYILFWGHQPSKDHTLTMSCLSQWWLSDFIVDGQKYCCMEQFMMACKAKLFHDYQILDQILNCSDPKRIKALGRKIKGFDEEIWNQYKYSIVYYGNYMKFSQNEDLKTFLKQTGNKIIAEASPYDGIWGIKMSSQNEMAYNPMKWKGQNLLGFALMQVRDALM